MRRLGNYPCQTILDTLKFSYVFTGNIVNMGLTVIKYTTNKRLSNSFSDQKRHISANATKNADMITTATTRFRDMLSKVKVMIKGHVWIL